MTQEELKLVLEALKWCHGGEPCGTAEAITVVEKALANVATNDTSKEYVDEMQKQRHEQEPVATVESVATVVMAMVESVATVVSESGNQEVTMSWWHEPALPVGTKLYTIPPQRTWVGLTNNDLQPIAEEYRILFGSWVHDFARAIEAKLKEKNT